MPCGAARGTLTMAAWAKTRRTVTCAGTDFGAPEEAVDQEKRTFIQRAARDYARRREVDWNEVRFDLVSVVLGDPPRVELRKDAFPCR